MNFSRYLTRTTHLLLAFLLLSLFWRPASASPLKQDPTPTPETTTYVVQTGDTLFAIAEAFGIPVDLLAQANGISDPSVISIGQTLIIPPPPEPAAPSIPYQIQPGDTLRALGIRFGQTEEMIALENHLLRPDALVIGDELRIPNLTTPPDLVRGKTLHPRPGYTLIGAALEQNRAPWQLAMENQWDSPNLLPAGCRLWVSGDDDAGFFDRPAPLAGVQIKPLPLEQGETAALQITTTVPVSLSGSLMDQSLSFHPWQSGQVALVGIDTLTEPALYTLVITAENETENETIFTQVVRINPGDYYSEDITVEPEIADQMTAEVVESEVEMLDSVFALDTEARLWSSPMTPPSDQAVTSLFGTRRTYNIPNGSAYHTGTDFATPEWTPVYAPADGVVVLTATLTVRGNIVVIDHGWGIMTGYWHLAKIYVNEGDVIQRGDHIADSGNTGLSTGPHLHWEFRVGNVPVDGLQWTEEQFP